MREPSNIMVPPKILVTHVIADHSGHRHQKRPRPSKMMIAGTIVPSKRARRFVLNQHSVIVGSHACYGLVRLSATTTDFDECSPGSLLRFGQSGFITSASWTTLFGDELRNASSGPAGPPFAAVISELRLGIRPGNTEDTASQQAKVTLVIDKCTTLHILPITNQP